MGNILTVIVALGALVVGAGGVWLLLRKKRELITDNGQGLTLIQNQLNELSRTNTELSRVLEKRLADSADSMHKSLERQFGESTKIVREVTERLTKLDDTNRQVISFTDQLKSLQDILKNPKQRGILGEYYLETLLKNTMPPGSYKMQYHLGVNDAGKELIPDAVVFVKDKIIPIDSKFSLENYNRMVETSDLVEKEKLAKLFEINLKERITETAKYIQPAKGTMDFAFMFIPHEAIYYDLLVGKVGNSGSNEENLIQRAAGKYKVIIVSPTSFLAYLQTVLQGLRALQIEESVKGVIKNVGELQKHLVVYEDYHSKMGNALGTVVNHYNSAHKEFKKVDKDILKITGESMGVETLVLEKPELRE